MGSYDPFGHLKQKLWPKEGSRVELPIWLPTTKSQELPWFPCVQVVCDIQLENFPWELQLCLNLTLIKGLHTKLWASKVAGVPIFEILGLPLGSPKTKWYLGAGPMVRHRVYYKGEGGGFSQVWAVVGHVSPCLPMTRSCTKSALAMH
jgi:hypothetical protein